MKTYIESEIRKDYERLTRLLIEKKLTITTMESATSGQIASLLTDTEGSSAVIKGAYITYSNEAKIKIGVPTEIIEKYSVYSNETSEAMASVCAKEYKANIGIGVTGTMGNVDPENKEASQPGEVYFSIYYNGEITNKHISIKPQKNRLSYKLAVAKEVYDELMRILNEQ